MIRNDNAPGRGALDLVLADAVKVPQHFLSMQRRVVEKGLKRQFLVLNDVPQSPRSAQPGFEIVPALFARPIAERVFIDLVGTDGERRCQPGTGGFSQNAQTSMERLIMARRSP